MVAFDPSWLHSLKSLCGLLCGLSSFSVSVFSPYSSLWPQGQPLLKERSFEQFAPSLPHYFTLAHSVSPRRTALGFHYSTSQSSSHSPLCAVIDVNSHTARQISLCQHYLLKIVIILRKKILWVTCDIILSSYLTLKNDKVPYLFKIYKQM